MVKTESLSNWAQVAASVGVIIGIALVIYELRQSQDIVRAQLVDNAIGMFTQQNTAAYGEELHVVHAKACAFPADLTDSDHFVLYAYFMETINRLRRNILISQRSDYYDDELWRQYAHSNFRAIFSTHAGRYWWAGARTIFEPQLVKVGDDILTDLDTPDCSEYSTGYSEFLEDALSSD